MNLPTTWQEIAWVGIRGFESEVMKARRHGEIVFGSVFIFANTDIRVKYTYDASRHGIVLHRQSIGFSCGSDRDQCELYDIRFNSLHPAKKLIIVVTGER